MSGTNPNTEELARSTREHDLKIWPEYFEAVESGAKPFEVRKIDRDYQPGDILRLREWYPNVDAYSGRECSRRITGILGGGKFGIADGYCVLGLGPIASAEQAHAAKDSPTLHPATDLPRRLRDSVEAMASACSVDMELWDRHSNAVLRAADVIEREAYPTLQDEGVRVALENMVATLDYVAPFARRASAPAAALRATESAEVGRQALATLSRGEAAEPACETCGGRGEIGGFDRGDNAWRTEPCPECEAAQARRDALLFGTSYLVDGKRVDPERVTIQVHHHEAGGAPGREKIARTLARYTWEKCVPAKELAALIERHWPDHLSEADAILALRAKPDQQGREQVIGELCEALDPVCGSLTVFPADLDEGDDEEREIYLTRRELKRIVRARDALKARSAAQ